MPFNINELKAEVAVNGGFLKNNKFGVLVTKPNGLPSSYGDLSSLFFYAESAMIPGISLQTSEIRRQGVGTLEKAVWGAAFTDCDVSFRIDRKAKTWNFFQNWMKLIYDFDIDSNSHYQMSYKNDYATTLTIVVYSDNFESVEKPPIIIDLIDAFPVSISDMSLNWGSSDILKLNVKFNFRSWNLRNISDFALNLSTNGLETFLRDQNRASPVTTVNRDPSSSQVNSRQRAAIPQVVDY